MPNKAIPARDNSTDNIQQISRRLTFSQIGLQSVGTLPRGAVVVDAGVVVTTAFNAGTTNVMDIGTASDPDGFATDLALGVIGRILADELAVSDDLTPAADTEVVCEYQPTGAAATAGSAIVYVKYFVAP